MSDPESPETSEFSGAFSWRPQRRVLFRRLLFAVGGFLLAVAGIAWLVHSTGSKQLANHASPGPGDHAPLPVCANADGTILRADVDGDGHVDEIRDPEREGLVTIVADRGDSPWRAHLDHALDREELQDSMDDSDADMLTRGTFGDFDGDGYVDLALFFSEPHLVDDPVENMPVHEVRYGPLARDLTSERVGPIDIGWEGVVYGVRATDQDGDGHAELQVFQTAGDGGVDHHTGHQDNSGVSLSEGVDFYDRNSWKDTEPGWHDFGVCADD